MMKLSEFTTTILIVGFMLVGVSIFVNDILVTQYNVQNATNMSSLNKMSELSNLTQDIQKKVQGATETKGVDLGIAVSGGWDAILVMFGSLNIVNELARDLGAASPITIPTWFTSMIILAVGMILVWGAYRFIRGTEQ